MALQIPKDLDVGAANKVLCRCLETGAGICTQKDAANIINLLQFYSAEANDVSTLQDQLEKSLPVLIETLSTQQKILQILRKLQLSVKLQLTDAAARKNADVDLDKLDSMTKLIYETTRAMGENSRLHAEAISGLLKVERTTDK